MADYIDTLKRTLRDLVGQRQHIDADIADLRRIIERHEGTSPAPVQPAAQRKGLASPPGEGRRETLTLMAAGGLWTPSKLAEARGTSVNGARAMLKRIAEEDPSPIEQTPQGYKIVSQEVEGDTQGSLSVAAEGDNRDDQEGGNDVVT